MNIVLEAEANAAIARGWLLTPLIGKRPILEDWPNLPQLTSGQIHKYCYDERNLGVRTGHGFVVVDTENCAVADIVAKLEAIGTVTVRTGGDGRHFYFKGDKRNSVEKLCDSIDVRGTGGQAVLPGSVHPDTGKPYEWIIHPDEAEMKPYPEWLDTLAAQYRKIKKSKPGRRNDTLNLATFIAAKEGAPTHILAEAASHAGLEPKEIVATIESATRAAPKRIAPLKVDGEIMVPGEHFFGPGETLTVDQTEFCRQVWARIPEGIFYHRLGAIGSIVDDTLQAVDVARLRVVASQYLHLVAYIKDGREYPKEYRNLNADLGALVLAAGVDYTDECRAIVRYPLAGGEHTGWIQLGEHAIEQVEDHWSFWKEVFCDFPFATENDIKIAVALCLTIIMRPLIRGPVPLFMITATQERTGKSLLINMMVARLIYGRDIANIALGKDDIEIDKRLIARSFGCHTVTSFDNVHGKVSSAVLASFITSTTYEGRILGQSKSVSFHNDMIIVATGNNLVASPEIAKRTMHIRLESPTERPEMRTNFKHNPLGDYLDSIRAKALGSLLAIAKMSGPAFIFGGCEDWGRLVGGAMAGAGMPLSQQAFMDWTNDADDESADVRILVSRLAESFLNQPLTTEEVLSQVKALNVMGRVQEPPTERGQVIRMGNTLRAIKGRVIGGFKLTDEGQGSHRKWRVVAAGPSPAQP